MSVTFALVFSSGRSVQQVLAGLNPEVDRWDYADTLGRGAEMLGIAADGAGVDFWRFGDSEHWHPIGEGVEAIEAMIRYVAEHPDVFDHGRAEGLVGAMRTVAEGLQLAMEEGETRFRLNVG
jgi:hypothetical protein